MAYSSALALVGSALAAAQGTVVYTNGVTVAITGQSVATAQGTAALLRALALLGVPATVSPGTVTPQGGSAVTVSLTGLVAALTAGSMSPELRAALNGEGLAAAAGGIYAVTPIVGGSPVPAFSPVGTLASPNPWYSTVTDEAPACIASANGCIMGRFAWLAEDGTVTNARMVSTDRLGFVLAQAPGYGAVFWSDGRAALHPGVPVSLMRSGDFWARFEYGAVQGAPVYADKATGKAISGYSASGEATPWWVVTDTAPGELGIISTTSRVQ
jgi:hypothetical protein